MKMKVLPEELDEWTLSKVEDRCRPGSWSAGGFLSHKDKLLEVVERDSETLARLGITHDQVADRLESICGQAWRIESVLYSRGEHPEHHKNLTRPWIYVERKFGVRDTAWMGLQTCPFKTRTEECGNTSRASVDVHLKNRDLGNERIDFPGLIIHLIRDHHFFEGNTHYRLDPEEAVRVLELEPGVDYSPDWRTETLWHYTRAGNRPPEEFLREGDTGWKAYHEPEAVEEPVDGLKAYLRDGICVVTAKGKIPRPYPSVFGYGLSVYGIYDRGTAVCELRENRYVEVAGV